MAALTVAGAVTGGGAGAREGGLSAALGQRRPGHLCWIQNGRGRSLTGALKGSTIAPPSKSAELRIQRQSAWPQAGRGRRQEREVRVGPGVLVRTWAGAAVAVTV